MAGTPDRVSFVSSVYHVHRGLLRSAERFAGSQRSPSGPLIDGALEPLPPTMQMRSHFLSLHLFERDIYFLIHVRLACSMYAETNCSVYGIALLQCSIGALTKHY